MTLPFAPAPENPTLRRVGHDLLPASLADTLEAAFSDPLNQPSLRLGLTRLRIARARRDPVAEAEDRLRRLRDYWPDTPESREGRAQLEARIDEAVQQTIAGRAPAGPSRYLTREELNGRYGRLGLDFDRPEREGVAEILAEQRLEQLIRDDVRRRGPRGPHAFAAQAGAALLASAMDPVNVAATFIPVVGEARYAGMIGRLGLSRARLARGAIEGAVGNAMVEPITMALARGQGLDYTAADALTNVALGGVLGAGLHSAVGPVADEVAMWRPVAREAGLRGAVAQLNKGFAVRMDPVVKAERRELGRAYDTVLRRPMGPVNDPLLELKPSQIDEVLVERGPAILNQDGEIVVHGGELKRQTGSGRGFGLVKVIWKHGARSLEDHRFRVTRGDVLALPEILRRFEPAETVRSPAQGFVQRVYRVSRGGRTVTYVVSRQIARDDRDHVVSVYVQDPAKTPEEKRFLSRPRRTGATPGSSSSGWQPSAGDTAAAPYYRSPRGRSMVPAVGTIAGAGLARNPEDDRSAAIQSQRVSPGGRAVSRRVSALADEFGPATPETARREAELQQRRVAALAGQLGSREVDQLGALARQEKRAEAFGRAIHAAATRLMAGG